MTKRRARRPPADPKWVSGLTLGLLLLAGGCTTAVDGSSSPPAGPAGSVAGAGVPKLPPLATAVLQRVPDTADSKTLIIVIDTPAVTRIAQQVSYPEKSGDAAAQRPKSETGYLAYLPILQPCASLDSTSNSMRTGTAGPSISLASATKGVQGSISLCGGAADATLVKKALGSGDGTPATVDGISGLSANNTFIGVDGANARTVIRAGAPQTAAVSAAINGTSVDTSLWNDPDLNTVLGQLPGAAVTIAGTGMLNVPQALAPAAVRTALATAVTQNGAGQPPEPEFAGYGWIPGARYVGTSVFVTVYGSDQEAARAASLFSAVWERLGTSRFTGAVTRTEGSTVTTTLVGTAIDEFRFSGDQLGDYPGFLGRR